MESELGPGAQAAPRAIRGRSRLSEFARRFASNRGALIAAGVLVTMLALTLLAEAIAPFPPDEQLTAPRLTPPGLAHPMGTDNLGRDVFSRVLYGGRLTLGAAVVALLIAVGIGVPLGLISGYAGRWGDSFIQRSMDVMLAFPGILLALAVVAVLGNGVVNVAIAVGISLIPAYVRMVRACVLSEKENVYVDAARINGCSGARIAVRHILPNVATPILVLSTTAIGWAIVIGATINFMNLGVQPPTAEWGADLAAARTYLRQGWWMGVFPGLAVTIVILAVNLIGDGLQEALDPRMRGRETR